MAINNEYVRSALSANIRTCHDSGVRVKDTNEYYALFMRRDLLLE